MFHFKEGVKKIVDFFHFLGHFLRNYLKMKMTSKLKPKSEDDVKNEDNQKIKYDLKGGDSL